MKNFLINELDDQNLRIDKWLKNNFSSLNQSFIEKNLRKGNIKVNSTKIIAKYKLQLNDEIVIFNYSKEVYFNQPKNSLKKSIPSKYSELFNSSIVYENSDFIILNKWTGIATQGGSKINISIDHIIKNISENYNLVHRLDRETSGLLIIAKNLFSTKHFGKLFKERLINKVYIATCQGKPINNESEINLTIPDKKDKNKSNITITSYKVIENKNKLSNIIFLPKTGKTHQIRIVAKHLGCPIIGDTKYNKDNRYNNEKLKLNACILNFTFNDHEYEFISELPKHFKNFINNNYLKKLNFIDIKKLL